MTTPATHPAKEAASGEYTRAGRTYRPDIDIIEDEEGLTLYADLPGVDEGSVDVQLTDGVLRIEGRVSPEDFEGLTPVYTEYNVGHFARRFTLSNAIDAARIEARITNGLLEVKLPKAEHAKPRRIPIS